MIETYIGLLALLALSPMSRMPAVLAVRQLPTYLVCGARGRRQSRATPKETRGARFGTGSEFLSSACCKKKTDDAAGGPRGVRHPLAGTILS